MASGTTGVIARIAHVSSAGALAMALAVSAPGGAAADTAAPSSEAGSPLRVWEAKCKGYILGAAAAAAKIDPRFSNVKESQFIGGRSAERITIELLLSSDAAGKKTFFLLHVGSAPVPSKPDAGGQWRTSNVDGDYIAVREDNAGFRIEGPEPTQLAGVAIRFMDALDRCVTARIPRSQGPVAVDGVRLVNESMDAYVHGDYRRAMALARRAVALGVMKACRILDPGCDDGGLRGSPGCQRRAEIDRIFARYLCASGQTVPEWGRGDGRGVRFAPAGLPVEAIAAALRAVELGDDRAWRFVAANACRVGDRALLETAWRNVREPDRGPVEEACARTGMVPPPRGGQVKE